MRCWAISITLSSVITALLSSTSVTSSKRFNSFRASPPEMVSNASVSFRFIFFSCSKGSFFITSFRSCTSSFLSSAFNTYTWQRLSKALFTSNEGFSVVAPISLIIPFSTAPNSASCCPLLKR